MPGFITALSPIHSGVSILVFVELALDEKMVGLSLEWSQVSILVFVELALDEIQAPSNLGEFVKFQSLFSWNLLLMTWLGQLARRSLPVSILVFVELALDDCDELFSFTRYLLDLFQSLFSWNLLLMPTRTVPAIDPKPAFNPCFRGTCSWCLILGT